MQSGHDRRRCTRYRVLKGSLFVLNHFSTRVGWIHDISKNGLCFEYVFAIGQEVAPEVIDIFAHQPSGIYLPSIKCRMIFNRRLEKDDELQNRTEIHRCGICFREMTELQREEMHLMIASYGRDLKPT